MSTEGEILYVKKKGEYVEYKAPVLYRECEDCGGNKEIDCDGEGCGVGVCPCEACDGTGRQNGHDLDSCDEQDCELCADTAPCEACEGSKEAPCDTCQGEATIKCETCRGEGYVRAGEER